MNERIRELALQARGQMAILTTVDDEQWRQHEEFVGKFAQLIVRECIEIVDKWSYDGPYREEGDIIPVKKIKQHFGVENERRI